MNLPSGRVRDISGKKFGEWEVLEFSHLDKFYNSVWKCKCSCGTVKYQGVRWLKSPNIGSCGCQKNRKISEHHKEDLTDKRFNRLVALRPLKKHKSGNVIWEWACDCGNIIEVKAGDVKSGNTKSCGCLNKEKIIERNIIYKRKPDNYSNKNTLFNHYKNHAKHRKLPFELTKDEFVEMAESSCHYCGVSPTRNFRANKFSGEWQAEGVDRIDSSKGYTTENTVSCCKQCNTMKMNYTEEQFYKKIVEIYNNKKLGDRLGDIQINNEIKL